MLQWLTDGAALPCWPIDHTSDTTGEEKLYMINNQKVKMDEAAGDP